MDIFTWEEQALIDGVELGIDYQMEVPPEDIKAYRHLLKNDKEKIRNAAERS